MSAGSSLSLSLAAASLLPARQKKGQLALRAAPTDAVCAVLCSHPTTPGKAALAEAGSHLPLPSTTPAVALENTAAGVVPVPRGPATSPPQRTSPGRGTARGGTPPSPFRACPTSSLRVASASALLQHWCGGKGRRQRAATPSADWWPSGTRREHKPVMASPAPLRPFVIQLQYSPELLKLRRYFSKNIRGGQAEPPRNPAVSTES